MRKQYESYYKKWLHFCHARQANPLHYNEILVIEFLTSLFNNKASYSAINTARCALSTLLVNDSNVTIGNSSLVKRFLKGVYELRPIRPRYNIIWDINIVLDFLKNFYPEDELSLDIITYKLVMLIALSTKQRAQTIHAISIDDIHIYSDCIVIPIYKLLKHTSRHNYKTQLTLSEYSDPTICVARILKLYIKRTSSLRRDHRQLFISFIKPYNPVSKETISRWLVKVMYEAGIDTTVYRSHSTRSASTSAAKRDNIPIDEIMKLAGWSSTNTFEKFYNKIIMPSV